LKGKIRNPNFEIRNNGHNEECENDKNEFNFAIIKQAWNFEVLFLF